MAVTYGEREMRAAELRDQELARLAGESNRVGRTGRMVRQVSISAVMNAVNTEGREVLGPDAEGYWRDQERRYPWIRRGREVPASVGVMKNRGRRVSWRKVFA